LLRLPLVAGIATTATACALAVAPCCDARSADGDVVAARAAGSAAAGADSASSAPAAVAAPADSTTSASAPPAAPTDSTAAAPPRVAAPVATPAVRWLDSAQLAAARDSLVLVPGQFRIDLSHPFLRDPITIKLSGVELKEGVDVVLDRSRGLLALPQPASGGEVLVVRYHYDQASAAHEARLHEPRPRQPALATVQPSAAVPGARGESARAQPPAGAGPEQDDLVVRGSKTVSVQGGTNRDATVDQALQLSATGRIAEGIWLRAEISDQNLPITPEGNTEELRDLDQVRIELYGRRGGALLGDFAIDQPLGAFLPYQRKLQGLALRGRSGRGSAALLGGSPRGTRAQVELRGREGVQGPYELLDPQRQDESFIIAGSERVWVAGELMRRGETNDYSIDYVRGTISFTERRPIGPESLIAIDFETSRTGYSRQVVAAIADSVRLGIARLRLGWLSEGDDPDRPSQGELSEQDRARLTAAGDDPALAVGNGVTAATDSTGQYDKLATAPGDTIFVFVGAIGGHYSVAFLRVGTGQGDYILDRLSETGVREFKHVGAAQGDYVVGRRLPLPARTRAAVASLDVGDQGHGSWARLELNATERDENVISPVGDGNNDDLAWRAAGATPWLWGGREGTGVRASALAEAIGGRFYETGRVRGPFFYEPWNLQGETRLTREGHEQLQLEARAPQRTGSLSLERLHRSGNYDGARIAHEAQGRLLGPLGLSEALSFTTASRPDQPDSFRRDRAAQLSWEASPVVPHLRWKDQHFTDGPANQRRGYRFDEWAAGVRTRAQATLAAGGEFRRRLADSLGAEGAIWRFAGDVREWRGDLTGGAQPGRITLEGTWRDARLPGGQRETTRLGRLTASRRPSDASVGADLEYRAGTDRSRALQRQIVFVGEKQGDYDAEGNPVGKRQGDYNVVFLPSDSLVAATDVELITKLDVTPPARVLGGLSSHTLFQVQERNTSGNVGDVLLLRPRVLRNAGTTIFGEQRLRQELVLLRSLRNAELGLIYDTSVRLDRRYANAPESSDHRLRNARLESEVARGWSLRLDAGDELRTRDTGIVGDPLAQGYHVLDRTAGLTTRYRPTPRARTSLELRATRRADDASALHQTVLEVVPGGTTDLLHGRWTAELRLASVNEGGGNGQPRPYFFDRPGPSRRASLLAQWGGSGLITVSLRYQVRDEPQRPLRHDLAVETRARF
jgi:hypothetical protein